MQAIWNSVGLPRGFGGSAAASAAVVRLAGSVPASEHAAAEAPAAERRKNHRRSTRCLALCDNMAFLPATELDC